MVPLETALMLGVGLWKNYNELEENLTLDEVEQLYMALQDKEWHSMKFAAALKGIDLPDPHGQEETPLERARNRAEAQMRGKTEEQVAFEKMGIGLTIIKEEE